MELNEDMSIRPLRLSDFAGQSNLKEQLRIHIDSARKRNAALEHILLSGPPGVGKTSLAGIIANEMDSRIIITSGVVLKPKDIADVLVKLGKGDILFIDEIHRLNHIGEEILYPAMEDFKLDVVVGDNNGLRTHQINLEKFTLIAATTRNGMISAPLRDRFGIFVTLELYNEDELTKVVYRSAPIIGGITLTYDGAFEIARRAHATPRIANMLLKRVRDYAIIKNGGLIDKWLADQALTTMGIDAVGLGNVDRKILRVLAGSKKPVGIKTVASMTGEDVRTIEDVYEPYLLKIDFISIEKNGRQITSKGLKHLNINGYKSEEKEESKSKAETDEEKAYNILGIPPDATDEQVKRAYKTLASIWHPDAHIVKDETRMKAINWAYEFIKKKRNFA